MDGNTRVSSSSTVPKKHCKVPMKRQLLLLTDKYGGNVPADR